MAVISVLCPYCGSDNVIRNGHHPNGKQRYMCKNTECPRSVFMLDYTYNACDPKVKEQILRYYSGRDITICCVTNVNYHYI